jgi:hypothetical protein
MELIVKTSDIPGDSSYKDGDIVQAFSNDRIHMCHADMICSPEAFPLDAVTGLRTNDGLLMKFTEATSKFKFIRLNANELKRINLMDSSEDIISNTANANGERIDIHEFLKIRLSFANHKVFGSSGAEIWYGGSRQYSVQDIWNDIETHTDNLMVDHSSWPFTELEKRHFLALNACTHGHAHDHTDFPSHAACLDCTCGCDLSEVAGNFVNERNACVFEDSEEAPMIAMRKYQVPYWDYASTLSLNVDDIRDLSKEVDGRKIPDERPTADLLTVNKIDAGIIVT